MNSVVDNTLHYLDQLMEQTYYDRTEFSSNYSQILPLNTYIDEQMLHGQTQLDSVQYQLNLLNSILSQNSQQQDLNVQNYQTIHNIGLNNDSTQSLSGLNVNMSLNEFEFKMRNNESILKAFEDSQLIVEMSINQSLGQMHGSQSSLQENSQITLMNGNGEFNQSRERLNRFGIGQSSREEIPLRIKRVDQFTNQETDIKPIIEVPNLMKINMIGNQVDYQQIGQDQNKLSNHQRKISLEKMKLQAQQLSRSHIIQQYSNSRSGSISKLNKNSKYPSLKQNITSRNNQPQFSQQMLNSQGFTSTINTQANLDLDISIFSQTKFQCDQNSQNFDKVNPDLKSRNVINKPSQTQVASTQFTQNSGISKSKYTQNQNTSQLPLYLRAQDIATKKKEKYDQLRQQKLQAQEDLELRELAQFDKIRRDRSKNSRSKSRSSISSNGMMNSSHTQNSMKLTYSFHQKKHSVFSQNSANDKRSLARDSKSQNKSTQSQEEYKGSPLREKQRQNLEQEQLLHLIFKPQISQHSQAIIKNKREKDNFKYVKEIDQVINDPQRHRDYIERFKNNEEVKGIVEGIFKEKIIQVETPFKPMINRK